jgi:acetyl esterase/lipase
MTKVLEIPLWPNEKPPVVEAGSERGVEKSDYLVEVLSHPRVYAYLPEKPNGTSVVICPGGGYGLLSTTKEGHDVARVLATWGVTSLVLYYTLPLGKYVEPPLPLRDAWQAIRLAKSRAKEWKLDEKKVGIMGFSAGGHLALTSGLKWDAAKVGSSESDRFDTQVSFMALAYPVVTLLAPYTHPGSRDNLLGKNADEALVKKYCGDLHVSATTPPAFIFHAEDDGAVSINNALFLAEAFKKNNRPYELMVHPTGGHGFGMGPRAGFPLAPDWIPAFKTWLEKNIF